MKRWLLFLVFLPAFAEVDGEQPVRLNLEECIRKARAQHPRLTVAAWEQSARESVLSQANAARFRPQVELTSLVGPVPGAQGSPSDPALRNDFGNLGAFGRAEITVIQPLYTFGKLEGKAAAAAHAVEVARQAKIVAANDIRRDTQKLYYGLLLTRELAGLADDVERSVQQALAKVKVSMAGEEGHFTPIDVHRLDVLRLEIQARRAALEASRTALTGALRATVGLPAGIDFDIAETEFEIPVRASVDVDSVCREARSRRPEMSQLRAGVAARSALVRSARADYYPQLFAGGFMRYGYAPNRTDQRNPFVRDDFNFTQGGIAIGLRYSINLAATRAKVKEAESEREALRAQLRLAETAVDVEARRAASLVQGAERTTDVRGESARAARSWLAAAQSNFNLGLGETRELVEAFQAYVQCRMALLQALHDENVARAELEHARGGY